MPLKTRKPYFRVDSAGPEYVVSHFRSVNGNIIRTASVRIVKGDTVAFAQELTAWIDKLPSRKQKLG